MNYFLLILSHQKSKFREIQLPTIKDNTKFIFKYFIGDPTMEEEYRLEGDIVYLKVNDNYESLSQKTYYAMKYIYENYKDIKGVLKTDDDIELDLNLLYKTIRMYKKSHYFGLYVDCREYMSDHHFNKCESPELNITKIKVPKCEYAAGGGYFIRRDKLNVLVEGKSFYDNTIFEDVATGMTMNNSGIVPEKVDIKRSGCFW